MTLTDVLNAEREPLGADAEERIGAATNGLADVLADLGLDD